MNYLLFIQPMIIKWANAGTCMHNVHVQGAHTCIVRGYLHKHQLFHTLRYACPETDRNRYSHTQIHLQRYSQYLFYTYKISFNIKVYLQLPTRHKFQQRHANNTRLTFKNILSSETCLIPQIYFISFADQETLKNKIPFPM